MKNLEIFCMNDEKKFSTYAFYAKVQKNIINSLDQ